MTVAELIEKLRTAPQDAPVWVLSCDAPTSEEPVLEHAVLVKTADGFVVALCEDGAQYGLADVAVWESA